MDKRHLATISILIKDRQSHAQDVNAILTEYGRHIIARLGVNMQRACVEHCHGLITIVVEAEMGDIDEITGKLDGLYGIVAKHNLLT